MPLESITHVTLPVSNLAESVEFYETVLEARPLGPPGEDTTVSSADRYWFRVGADQFLILLVDSNLAGGDASGGLGPTVTFRTDESDLVGLRARLDALGYDYSESTTSLSFSDPNDNRLEVTTDVVPP